ncbi:MAG: hypothetical protein JNL87_23005 [Burkholderiaceae bacterium]|nr:hypothetical protein [Burkholderiaceae bacterium]
MSDWNAISRPAPKDDWDAISRPDAKAPPKTAPAPEPTYDPAEGMSPLEKLAVGAGAAVARVGRGIGHLLPAWKDDPRLAEADENARLYEKHHPGGWATAGEVGADIAMSLVPMGAAAKAATMVQALRGAKAGAALIPAAADVAANAGYAALTAPENRGTAAALAGAGAGVGRVLTNALGGTGVQSRRVGKLIENDVTPTVGQALRTSNSLPGRAFARMEDTLADVPVIGAPVRHARERAMSEWQAATRAAAGVPEAGSIADVGRELGNRYTTLFNELDQKMPVVDMTGMSLDVINAAKVQHNLTDEQLDTLASTVINTINSHSVGESMGAMKPSTANEIGKRLLKLSQRYKSAPDPRQADFGHALEQVAYTWRDHTAAKLGDPPDLLRLNQDWSNYAPLREIAKTGDLANPSEYTPKLLLQAIRRGDRSANKSGFIEGGDLPQQALAKAGQDVIGSPSGVTSPIEKAVGIGGAVLGAYSNLPLTAALSGTVLALYSKPVQELLISAAQNGTTVSRFLADHPELHGVVAQSIAARQSQDRPQSGR